MARPTVQIVPARPAHAEALAPRMREPEVLEVRASGGYDPLTALLDALEHSERAYAALIDGEVACMWGVEHVRYSAASGRVGAVWLLTSPLIEKHRKVFWKGCRLELRSLFEAYDLLVNAIDARHVQAVRWARRLGFPLEEPRSFGVEGRQFYWFRVRREDLHRV